MSALVRFVERLIFERDALEDSVLVDVSRVPPNWQSLLGDDPWPQPFVIDEGGRRVRTETAKLRDEFRPNDREWELRRLHRRALDECRQDARATRLIPLLDNALEAHSALIDAARESVERVDVRGLDQSLPDHWAAIVALDPYLPIATVKGADDDPPTKSDAAVDDETDHRKRKGGRPRKWEALWTLIQRHDNLSDEKIAKKFNQQYARAITDGQKTEATADTVKTVRHRYGQNQGSA